MNQAIGALEVQQGLLWGEFFITSRTTPGAFWRTTIGTTPTCTCPAGRHDFARCKDGECAHVTAARVAHERYTSFRVA